MSICKKHYSRKLFIVLAFKSEGTPFFLLLCSYLSPVSSTVGSGYLTLEGMGKVRHRGRGHYTHKKLASRKLWCLNTLLSNNQTSRNDLYSFSYRAPQKELFWVFIVMVFSIL